MEAELIVMDANVSISWANHRYITPVQRRYCGTVTDHFTEGGQAIVPSIWFYEVSNVLTTLIRQQLIARMDAQTLLSIFRRLPIQHVPVSQFDELNGLMATAEDHALSSYDAAYLLLAQQSGAKLATLDKKLMQAAKRMGLYFEA